MNETVKSENALGTAAAKANPKNAGVANLWDDIAGG